MVGYEACGVIETVGPAVADFTPGARVIALTHFGGYATKLCVPAAQCWPLPAEMSFSEGAAIPVNSVTAWLALFTLGGLKPGETVLVRSAGGGVGTIAVQLAAAHGARVIGVASEAKNEILSRLGVQMTIPPRSPDFVSRVLSLTGGNGVDVCLNPVGGGTLREDGRILAPLGRIVAYGVSSIAPGRRRRIPAAIAAILRTPLYHPISLMNSNRGILGLNMGHLWGETARLRSAMKRVMELCAEGKVKPIVGAQFAFEKVREAHRYIQSRKSFGKVVLTVGSP